jgi:hypothetical protein
MLENMPAPAPAPKLNKRVRFQFPPFEEDEDATFTRYRGSSLDLSKRGRTSTDQPRGKMNNNNNKTADDCCCSPLKRARLQDVQIESSPRSNKLKPFSMPVVPPPPPPSKRPFLKECWRQETMLSQGNTNGTLVLTPPRTLLGFETHDPEAPRKKLKLSRKTIHPRPRTLQGIISRMIS